MKKAFWIMCLALVTTVVLFQKPAFAEEKNGYAYYEYDFGIKLIKFNFWSLAEKHFEAFLKDPKIPADARTKGYLGLAILYKHRGKNPRATPKEREENFDKALANLTEFLQKWPDKNSADYRIAEVEKYGIEIDRVEARILELKDIPPNDETRKSKEEAARIKLREAIEKLRGIHDAIRDERLAFEEEWLAIHPEDDFEPYPEELKERWDNIGYVLARSYFIYPDIFVSGTDEFKKAVEFAKLGLEDFVWEHWSDSVYIHGGMFLAKLFAQLYANTKVPEERTAYKDKIQRCFEDFVFGFKPDEFQFLRERAFNDYAEILSNLGFSDEIAGKVWERYKTDYPNWLDETMYGQGYHLASRVALVMLENNKAPEAVDLLSKVIEKANIRNMLAAASIASKNLATIIDRLGPESMSIITLLQAGKGFKGKGDWVSAITYYQYVIQGLDKKLDEEELKKLDHKTRTEVQKAYDEVQRQKIDIGTEAFQNISECFEAVGLRLEAILCANEVVNRYNDNVRAAINKDKVSKLVLRSGKSAYTLARELFFDENKRGVASKETGELYINALQNLQKVDPTQKDRVTYDLGQVGMTFGEYLKAITTFQKVSDSDSKYADAQYNICVCYVRLSQEAEGIGDNEGKLKFQISAIDSLNAVINMDRKWGVSDKPKQDSWERKRSACFMLLGGIFSRQSMNAELVTLAEKWLSMYGDKLASEKSYIRNGDTLFRSAISAALTLGHAAKADELYLTAKSKIVLLGKPQSVAVGKKYDVTEDIGVPYSDLSLKLAAAMGAAGNADKQKFYTLESDKWSGEDKSPAELYNELARYQKTLEIYSRKVKELLAKIETFMEANPLDRKVLLSEDYIKAIYFTGDKAKADKMTAAYRNFINYLLGGRAKLKINYYSAKKAYDELKALDTAKAAEIWGKPMMKKIGTVVDYCYIRHNTYKKAWSVVMEMKQPDYELVAQMLEYLVDYYPSEDEYKINAAIAYRKIKVFDKALGMYGILINDRRKNETQCEYRYLVALTYKEMVEATTEVKDRETYIEKGLSQLGFIEKLFPNQYNEKMANLRAVLESLKTK